MVNPGKESKRLDEKLQRMQQGVATRHDFIIADAKDGDMAFGMATPGPDRQRGGWKSLEDYREQIRAVVEQDVVDIMLLSASNLEQLGMKEGLFANSAITPAARANDTTDIWAVRYGSYSGQASRPFRSATLDHIMHGRIGKPEDSQVTGADLGLYSITFTNDLDWDYRAMQEFRAFRLEAEQKGFRYFLEVFNPNVDTGLSAEETAAFMNDHIARVLAGVPSSGRPLFLKIPYNGPGALEELVSYDPNLIVGVLGGNAGTTLDAFQLIHDAQKYGARVALFGRKINLSEDPLSFIRFLRGIVDGELGPVEAVKAYHGALAAQSIAPLRSLEDDLRLNSNLKNYR